MLVLSRRESDRIVFPTLGISIEVMKLTRSRASLGIKAPKGIRVVRHELLDQHSDLPFQEDAFDDIKRNADTAVQDQVNAASQSLLKAQDQLQMGNTSAAMDSIVATLMQLNSIACRGDQATSVGTPEAVKESSAGYACNRSLAQVTVFAFIDETFPSDGLVDRLRRRGCQISRAEPVPAC